MSGACWSTKGSLSAAMTHLRTELQDFFCLSLVTCQTTKCSYEHEFLLLYSIFFEKNGKNFAVHFIRQRKWKKKQKKATKYLQNQIPWINPYLDQHQLTSY